MHDRAATRVEQQSKEAPEIWWLGLERKWWVLTAVGAGTFMSAMNSSIVNTVVPLIMADFRIDLGTAEWIIMMYLVMVSGLLLTFGRLGDMIGHKPMFIAGAGTFTLGSVLCGLASTALMLIALRVLQAIGGAMLLSSSPAILAGSFPARQRGQALGMQGTMTYLGLMVGPALGGFLAGEFGWRSIFLITLPVGLMVAALGYAAFAHGRPAAAGEKFDPAGAMAFLVGLSALLLALSHGQTWGWTSAIVVGLLATGALLLAVFVRIERRVSYPMLDLTLFRTRLFTAATISAVMNYICLYAVSFLMPFYLIQYRGLDPAHAGLLISSQAVIMAVAAPLSGSISDRVGSRLPSTAGMAIVTVGVLGLGSLDASAGDSAIIGFMMLAGLGMGVFASPNSSAMLGAVPPQRRGVASAVLAGARNVGMVLGIALAGAVLAAMLALYGGTIGPSAGFLPAFHDTLLAVAACGAIGTVTSMVRGGQTNPATPPPGR